MKRKERMADSEEQYRIKVERIRNRVLTPEEVAMIDQFNAEIKDITIFAEKYGDNVGAMFDMAVASAAKTEESVGGEILYRGYYCPSQTVDIVLHNANRGKLRTARMRKPSTFKYYFDDLGRLSAVDDIYDEREVIIYENKAQYGLHYHIGHRPLIAVRCDFSNGIQTSKLEFGFDVKQYRVRSLEAERYFYDQYGHIINAQYRTYLPEYKFIKGDDYTFKRDMNGTIIDWYSEPLAIMNI